MNKYGPKKVTKFDFNELKEDFRATMIAPSKSGKTEYLLYMLSQIVKWYKYIFLIVPCVNDKYANYIWPNHVFIVENIQEINQVIKSILDFGASLTKKGKKKQILVITDDLGLMTSNPSCKIDTLLLRGRGVGISVVILAQSYQMISPNMRNNITHTFIFAITDDFYHYVKNIPKSESVQEVMTRLKRLFIKLSGKCEEVDREENRQTRYNAVISTIAGGSMCLSYSYIEDYSKLYKRNILSRQISKMKYTIQKNDEDDTLIV